MAETKMTIWNSAGIRASTATTPANITFFDKENPHANYTIAALVETHHRDKNDFPH